MVIRRKIATIYRKGVDQSTTDMFGRSDNMIDTAVKAVLKDNLPKKGEPQLVRQGKDAEGVDLPPHKVYNKEWTSYIAAENNNHLFGMITFLTLTGIPL